MKKKLFSLLTALVLCLFCAVPAFAEMPLVMDTYELFPKRPLNGNKRRRTPVPDTVSTSTC